MSVNDRLQKQLNTEVEFRENWKEMHLWEIKDRQEWVEGVGKVGDGSFKKSH